MELTIIIGIRKMSVMGTISRNFSYHEFEASGVSKSKGIVNKIDSDDVRNAIRALVLNVLQPDRKSVV